MDANEELLEWIKELEDEDHMICAQRACISLGWTHVLDPDEGLLIDGDTESDEFEDAMWQQYALMYVNDTLDDLADRGLVEISGVDPETGALFYSVTEAGEAALDPEV